MKTLDFRSDTVTKPTPSMWTAMAHAEVGDDVYGEDPTVNQLQELAAKITGKEAALLVPTGTMGNLAAMLAHCQRGEEVILGHLAHTYLFEAGGLAALGGLVPCVLQNQNDGTLLLNEIEASIKMDDPHFAKTKLITLENTHNRCGGVSLSVAYTNKVAELAKRNQLKLHIDGARLFNAAVDQKVPASALVEAADSVTFCLSKGLSAPVGSVLCGSEEFIYKASRARKQLGGGMRQAGVFAAAGIVALETMRLRLAEDHEKAQYLSNSIKTISALRLTKNHTNMVYFELAEDISLTAERFVTACKAQGLLFGQVDKREFRMVVHSDIEESMLESAISILKSVV